MSTFFKNQGFLRIKLDTRDESGNGGVDLTGYTCWIKYRKPDGTEGHWVATMDATNHYKMYYDIIATTEIDQAGTWVFWAYYLLGDLSAPGEIVRQEFTEEGHMKNRGT
jgi:hypothetical protein